MSVPELSSYPTSPVVTVSDVERIAVGKLPKNALDYYRSGADNMQTLRENRDAFKRYSTVVVYLVF